MSELVEVKVSGLALDERSRSPVVLLQELGGTRVLPIWIGAPEANSIAMELAGKKFQRPLTHDLLRTVIEGLKGTIRKILITDLKDGTFFARILITRDNDVIGVDARPSDSIALALRAHSPIFVSEELFQPGLEGTEADEEKKKDQIRDFLRNLPPEDFGNIAP
ncbi:MAG: bifunctional nuclease family protein [Candidatus Eisenbacteria bacterium]|nr:bifunctional nuclease family protein [Candidatus Eisenbacteria bacterium]